MKKPKFYQAVLQEVNGNVLDHVYPRLKGTKDQMTLAERLGNENGECEMCGENEWYLLPKESLIIQESGKPYMECLNCAHVTHL
jgi:hypothetical protein